MRFARSEPVREFSAAMIYQFKMLSHTLPWFDLIRKNGYTHGNGVAARDFLNLAQYKHANAWADRLCSRVEVQRGMLVCRGEGKPWLSDNPRYKSRFGHLREAKAGSEPTNKSSRL